MILIAAAHQYACAVSVQSYADMWQLLNQAVERRSCSPPRMVMVPSAESGSQSSLMALSCATRKTNIIINAGPSLHSGGSTICSLGIIHGPITGADDSVTVRSALCLRT